MGGIETEVGFWKVLPTEPASVPLLHKANVKFSVKTIHGSLSSDLFIPFPPSSEACLLPTPV